MRLIKGESSHWINQQKLIKHKFAWQDEYFVASVSESNLDSVRKYIAAQEEHHAQVSFGENLRNFLSGQAFTGSGIKGLKPLTYFGHFEPLAEASGNLKGEASGNLKGEASGNLKGEASVNLRGEASGNLKGEASGNLKAKPLAIYRTKIFVDNRQTNVLSLQHRTAAGTERIYEPG